MSAVDSRYGEINEWSKNAYIKYNIKMLILESIAK